MIYRFRVILDNDTEDDTKKPAAKEDVASEEKKKNSDNKEEEQEVDSVDNHPDSFSPINPCRKDIEQLYKEYPNFKYCKQVLVEVNAGQILYLPCGWFHEVTSYSTIGGGTANDDNNDETLQNCHVALNYWYHPPDALDNYENPYLDNFWKLEEEQRLGISNSNSSKSSNGNKKRKREEQ